MDKLIKFLKEKYLIITPVLLIISIAQIDQYSQLTTSGTFGAALRLSIPIMLAGLGGLFQRELEL